MAYEEILQTIEMQAVKDTAHKCISIIPFIQVLMSSVSVIIYQKLHDKIILNCMEILFYFIVVFIIVFLFQFRIKSTFRLVPNKNESQIENNFVTDSNRLSNWTIPYY